MAEALVGVLLFSQRQSKRAPVLRDRGLFILVGGTCGLTEVAAVRGRRRHTPGLLGLLRANRGFCLDFSAEML